VARAALTLMLTSKTPRIDWPARIENPNHLAINGLKLATLPFASWNHVRDWFSRLDALRSAGRLFGATA
jgi:hypothetical protein